MILLKIAHTSFHKFFNLLDIWNLWCPLQYYSKTLHSSVHHHRYLKFETFNHCWHYFQLSRFHWLGYKHRFTHFFFGFEKPWFTLYMLITKWTMIHECWWYFKNKYFLIYGWFDELYISSFRLYDHLPLIIS